MAGFREARGDWEYRLYDLTATSNLSQGTAVALAGARTVSEYSGGQAGLLGFLKHPSQNSIPAGKVIVAIPKPGCTAWADVPTGVAASALSLGQSYGIYKSGGVCSFITDAAYSDDSRVVNIVGALRSDASQIEVSFLIDAGQHYSVNSTDIG